MTEQQIPRPLIIEETVVTVPVREPAQRAFEDWFKSKADELTALLAPWGLDQTNVVLPQLHRLVYEGDGRWVGDIGRGPDPRYLTDEHLALFREATVIRGASVDVKIARDDEEGETDGDQ